MGKLVLGILFVILLQIAFFGFTSTYWSAPNESIVAGKPLPGVSSARPSVDSTSVPPTTEVTEKVPSSVPKVIENRRAAMRPRAESVHRVRKARPRDEVRVVTYPAPARIRTENTELSAVAPRRHYVVVNDELAKVSSEKPANASKPRKRSFLAKSYSVVVKKPWNWMKSIVSKLN